MDFYLRQAAEKKDDLKQSADYIVNDGACAKTGYVNGIVNRTGLHPVSRLRKDADLRYLRTGPKREGKGRRKEYDGKINSVDRKVWRSGMQMSAAKFLHLIFL